MRTEPTADLINTLVLVGKLQALSVQHNQQEPLNASNAILNRVIRQLMEELHAENQAREALKKARHGPV